MIYDQCNMEELEICAMVARSLWTRRNALVHGESFVHPNKFVSGAEDSLQQYKKAQLSGGINDPILEPAMVEKWTNPPSGKYKVNWVIAID